MTGEAPQADGPSHRERLAAYRAELERGRLEYVRQESRWSWFRLVAFFICVLTIVVFAVWFNIWAALIAAAPFLVLFHHAVARHLLWKGKRLTTDRLLAVVDESLHDSVAQGKPVRDYRRPEDGPAVSEALPTVIPSGPTWPLTDQERDDLDLYARPVGVFGLLNRTSTDQGSRRLRDMLDGPCLSVDVLRQRQEAVRWLDGRERERLAMMGAALPLRHRSEQLDALVDRLVTATFNPHGAASRWIRIWSVGTALASLYGFFQVFQGRYAWGYALALVVVLNSLIASRHKHMLTSLRDAVLPLVELAPALRGLLGVARCARENLPGETSLNTLREHLDKVVTHAEVPALCERLGWMGLGGVARMLLNLIAFYDLHVGEAILARFVPHRDILLNGLAASAELEALASLASFSAAQPVKCYPRWGSEATVSIDEGRHPLIAFEETAPNSMQLTSEKRMWVITGPNAAGKSTYLRMVGVNVLLAQVGAAAVARDMTLSPVRLQTDVRIRDDLARHESYFLSEVRRLRRMVLDDRTDAPLFGLIDEPFRGTNSSERTAAGIALTEHLMASANLFLLATHQETLAETAAKSDSAENRHFQEHLTDDGIVFDYRLRPGPAETRTAIRILEQERYPQTLLERARALMRP